MCSIGVIIRLGVESDLPSIRQLSEESDIFQGWDYLPGMWKEWVNDPRFIMVVAIKEENVVHRFKMRLQTLWM